MVLVASSSHTRSPSSAINATELKNFTALGFGLPSARSLPALAKVVVGRDQIVGRLLASFFPSTKTITGCLAEVVPILHWKATGTKSK
jgi:hypothetical protein